MQPYNFRAYDEFLNRDADLQRLEDWWAGRDRNALALYGLRRVGKSWLFRRFAHGKPAIVLVSDRRALGAQLSRFAEVLKDHLGGVVPQLPDLPALFSTLYAIAAEEKVLVVIDEFPYLLPSREKDRIAALTAVQAVMEERDASQLKLVLCGSYIDQMETLLSESSPIRGRLTPLLIEPLRFTEAQAFITSGASDERIERYAVAGGMSQYLVELGNGGGSLQRRICERVLDHRGPLFNDPREVLEEELRQPGVHFSLLEELSYGQKGLGDLATALGKKSTDLTRYIEQLRDMRLIEKIIPVFGPGEQRFRVSDGFLRFWFRFVFPFQDDLKTGLRPQDHYAGEIAPALSEHVSPAFEGLCREWTRRQRGRQASKVGSWWGNALNEHRRSGERQTEEIDVVGVSRGRIALVGECKWTSGPMTMKVLTDLESYKIPAMRQAGIKFSGTAPLILLFSRSGFKDNLVELANQRHGIQLIGVDQLVQDLTT